MAALSVALGATGCSGGGQGEPAELSGVATITPLAYDEALIAAALEDDVAVLEIVDEHRVEVAYCEGPMCRADTHRQEPGAVVVAYGRDRIDVAIDPITRGCGDAAAAEILAAIEIELEFPIDGRRIDLRLVSRD